jgi:HSP20 family protein
MRTGNPDNNGKPEIIEPATILTDEGKFIHVVTELPGIAEEKIRIDMEKTRVIIGASDNKKQYKKEIILPSEVIFNKKRFSEGKLHLTLEKKGS